MQRENVPSSKTKSKRDQNEEIEMGRNVFKKEAEEEEDEEKEGCVRKGDRAKPE